jgi:hypothetical protein
LVLRLLEITRSLHRCRLGEGVSSKGAAAIGPPRVDRRHNAVQDPTIGSGTTPGVSGAASIAADRLTDVPKRLIKGGVGLVERAAAAATPEAIAKHSGLAPAVRAASAGICRC